MNGLVDTSVFLGHWPFRPMDRHTPDGLKAHLASRGVTRAWAASAEAILLPDPMLANEPLLAALADDLFYAPVAIVDVSLATWERDASRCLCELGARALKLTPNYHSVGLTDSRVSELADVAREANAPVCVQMRMMDERGHHPLMKVAAVPADGLAELAGRHPDVRFLACGAYLAELATLAPARNIWAEISFVEAGQTLRAALEVMGADRLVFASHSPLCYFEPAAVKLDPHPDDVAPEDVAAVGGRNASELLEG
jgi:uncharacterized protein